MKGRSFFLILLVSVVAAIGQDVKSESVTLETVRALVARNEALLNPIKMSYTVRKSRTGERPQPTRGSRRGRSYSHFNCVWAQSGQKHYARVNRFFGPNEPANSTVEVIEPDLVTKGRLPDLMEGTISPRDSHDWYAVLVAKLGLRPFEGHYTLSQILVPEYASVHKQTEMVDGREMYVVDAKRPSVYPYFTRIWIDGQRGIPLRIQYFDKHPNWSDARMSSEITDIKHFRLPNGGWIPIEGIRSLHLRAGSISYEHMIVDVNSITIRREDIPDSLFKIDFSEGAGIYDVRSGLTTIKGQHLKTYEQVINTDGSYIAGIIMDGTSIPIPGVIVGPSTIRTKQNLFKLIQGYERPCAITDTKGRFAIELDEAGSYDLLVFSEDYVDKRVRNIPSGTHDLKITLLKGGTVTGRVVRLMADRKIPVCNAEVKADSVDRISRTMPRPYRAHTKTDSEGRFEIKCLQAYMPERGTSHSEEPKHIPIAWQISCGSVSETVLFEEGKNTQGVELVLKPNLEEAVPLIGRTLPDFEGIKIDSSSNQTNDKMMLVCFFDMNQRPSRNYIVQLVRQAEFLREQGINLTAVQAVKADENALRQWVMENNIFFPVGMIQDDEECVRFDWAVCSLPWLILTDKEHIVQAEGFGLNELEDKIREAESAQ